MDIVFYGEILFYAVVIALGYRQKLRIRRLEEEVKELRRRSACKLYALLTPVTCA